MSGPGSPASPQISGRNAISWEDKFALDLQYVDNHDLRMDLEILIADLRRRAVAGGHPVRRGRRHARVPGYRGSAPVSAVQPDRACRGHRSRRRSGRSAVAPARGLERHGPHLSGGPPARGLRGSRPPGRRTRPRSGSATTTLTYRELNARANAAGPTAGRARGRARHPGRGLHGAIARDGRRAVRDPEGRARRTCPSTPSTRPIGSRSCSTTPDAPILLDPATPSPTASGTRRRTVVAVDRSRSSRTRRSRPAAGRRRPPSTTSPT